MCCYFYHFNSYYSVVVISNSSHYRDKSLALEVRKEAEFRRDADDFVLDLRAVCDPSYESQRAVENLRPE